MHPSLYTGNGVYYILDCARALTRRFKSESLSIVVFRNLMNWVDDVVVVRCNGMGMQACG